MLSKVILGVTSSIAAYKVIDIAKTLLANSCDIKIILSENTQDFISLITLKSLFPGRVYAHDAMLDDSDQMLHITLAKQADLVMIAPASANMIAKLSTARADCLLSTICLATKAPIALAPAMNKVMWENKLVQSNIAILKNMGFHILGPAAGLQACGDTGLGRMVESDEIVQFCCDIKIEKLFLGQKIIITAGPTREKIDPVRFFSNYSSGKMGYALAQMAYAMGANVTLIHGPTALKPVLNCKMIAVESADEMFDSVKKEIANADIFISNAAIADYKPKNQSIDKIKKTNDHLELKLVKNIDIISYIKQHHPKVFSVGFAAETQNIQEYGYQKLQTKHIDLIAINDVSNNKVFGSDENELHLITKSKQYYYLKQDSKINIAHNLLKYVAEQISLNN